MWKMLKGLFFLTILCVFARNLLCSANGDWSNTLVTEIEQIKNTEALQFLVDTSGSIGRDDVFPSMKNIMKKIISKIREPKVMVTSFSQSFICQEPCEFTNSQIGSRINGIPYQGSGTDLTTGLLDSLPKVKEQTRLNPNEKPTLFILTDGRPNDQDTVVEFFRENKAFYSRIFFMAFGDIDEACLETLASESNGNYIKTTSVFEIEEFLEKDLKSAIVLHILKLKMKLEYSDDEGCFMISFSGSLKNIHRKSTVSKSEVIYLKVTDPRINKDIFSDVGEDGYYHEIELEKDLSFGQKHKFEFTVETSIKKNTIYRDLPCNLRFSLESDSHTKLRLKAPHVDISTNILSSWLEAWEPKPLLFTDPFATDPEKITPSLWLLAETGTGKSTFLNTAFNAFLDTSEDFRETVTVGRGGNENTNTKSIKKINWNHEFTNNKFNWSIIDTWGIDIEHELRWSDEVISALIDGKLCNNVRMPELEGEKIWENCKADSLNIPDGVVYLQGISFMNHIDKVLTILEKIQKNAGIAIVLGITHLEDAPEEQQQKSFLNDLGIQWSQKNLNRFGESSTFLLPYDPSNDRQGCEVSAPVLGLLHSALIKVNTKRDRAAGDLNIERPRCLNAWKADSPEEKVFRDALLKLCKDEKICYCPGEIEYLLEQCAEKNQVFNQVTLQDKGTKVSLPAGIAKFSISGYKAFRVVKALEDKILKSSLVANLEPCLNLHSRSPNPHSL